MDITKIEEARKLFDTYDKVIRAHGRAIIDHKEVIDKHCDFDYLNKAELHRAVRDALHRHFEGLKDKIKAEIEKL